MTALRIGPIPRCSPPVVLAPMAGITNAPFRTLCRRFSQDRCLYVSEMITARRVRRRPRAHAAAGLVRPRTRRPRSIQLYGTHPTRWRQRPRELLVEEWGVTTST
jgi:tRNA-dihydrouridine synthase